MKDARSVPVVFALSMAGDCFGLGVITGEFLATDRYLDAGCGWDDGAGRYTCPSPEESD